MKKLIFLLLFSTSLFAQKNAFTTKTIGSINMGGFYVYKDTLVGIVHEDSVGVIRQIEVEDIGNKGKLNIAITNAMAKFTSGWGVIVLPTGNFTHTASILVSRDSLYFVGHGTRINVPSSTFLSTERHHHIVFEGIEIIGDTTYAAAQFGIWIRNSKDVTIHNCRFMRLTHSGVFASDTSTYVNVSENYFENIWGPNNSNTGVAIFFIRGVNNSTIANNIILGRGSEGIGIDDGSTADTTGSVTPKVVCSYNVISGNTISGIQYSAGIKIESSSYNTVVGNNVTLCGVGISLNNTQQRNPVNKNIVSNNHIYNNANTGLGIQGGSGNLVSNNLIEANGYTASPTGYGILIQYRDYLANSPIVGLAVDTMSSDSNLIMGNVIRYNARDGVKFISSGITGNNKGNVITDNFISDTSTGPTYSDINGLGSSNFAPLNYLSGVVTGTIDSMTIDKIKSSVSGSNNYLTVDDGVGNSNFTTRGGLTLVARNAAGAGSPFILKAGQLNTAIFTISDTLGSITGTTYQRGTSSFSGANTRAAVYLAGATSGDIYTVSEKSADGTTPPVAGNLMSWYAKTDSLIVVRAAGTLGGQSFSYMRMK